MNRTALPGVSSDFMTGMKKPAGRNAPSLADFQALLEDRVALPGRPANGLSDRADMENPIIGNNAALMPALAALECRLAKPAAESPGLVMDLPIELEGAHECPKAINTGLEAEPGLELGQELDVQAAPIRVRPFMPQSPDSLINEDDPPEIFPGQAHELTTSEPPDNSPVRIDSFLLAHTPVSERPVNAHEIVTRVGGRFETSPDRPSDAIFRASGAHELEFAPPKSAPTLSPEGLAGTPSFSKTAPADPASRVSERPLSDNVLDVDASDPDPQALEDEAVIVAPHVKGADIEPDAVVLAGSEHKQQDNGIGKHHHASDFAREASVPGSLRSIEAHEKIGGAMPGNDAGPLGVDSHTRIGVADKPRALPAPNMTAMQQQHTPAEEKRLAPQRGAQRPDVLTQMPMALTEARRKSGTADDTDVSIEPQSRQPHPSTSSTEDKPISRLQAQPLEAASAGSPILAAEIHFADHAMTMRTQVNPAPALVFNSQIIAAEVAKLTAELAAPRIFLNEAEEMRAELQGQLKSVRIKLQPESLGEVSINVHSVQAGLRVEVRVQSDDAGRALLTEIDGIAGLLSGLGVNIEQLTLTAPGGGITVVHAPAHQAGNSVLDSQSGQFREHPAERSKAETSERHKPETDETNGNKELGIYI